MNLLVLDSISYSLDDYLESPVDFVIRVNSTRLVNYNITTELLKIKFKLLNLIKSSKNHNHLLRLNISEISLLKITKMLALDMQCVDIVSKGVCISQFAFT